MEILYLYSLQVLRTSEFTMKLLSLVTLAAFAAATKPTVYLIRHGEKPEDDDERGLSVAGIQRAQCLRQVFGASSPYNIGHIMAQEYKPSKKRASSLYIIVCQPNAK